MRRRSRAPLPGPRLVLAALAFGATTAITATAAQADDSWAVPNTPMRLKADIDSHPTSPENGILVSIPNGGALPGPFPNATIVGADGKQVKAECVWNNPREGCAFVFPEVPSPVYIYLDGASNPVNPWGETSALHPSLLLYTRPGNASLIGAQHLASEFPPTAGVRMGSVPTIADAQNRFGSSDNYVSYYTGWLDLREAGSYFIGTISQDGSLIDIDGKVATEWPGIHPTKEGLTGKKGNNVTLAKGSHRVQYYQFSSEGGSAMSLMIWRPPSRPKGEQAKTMDERDFQHSGSVHIVGAESRNGAPPALFTRRDKSYMSFANAFVDLYDLNVPFASQYKDVTYDWRFSDGCVAHGPHVLWLNVRGSALTVTLTINSPHGASSSTHALYPDTLPPGAKVENQSDRHDYAEGLFNRLQCAPDPKRPADSWPAPYWDILSQVVQGGEAQDLLGLLFQRAADSLGNLPAEERQRLGEIYYDELRADKANAPGILRKIIAAQKEPAHQFLWELKGIDFLLFELGDIPGARQMAAELRPDPFHGAKHDVELRLIALGDIERIAGNADAATGDYAAAEAEYQKLTRAPFGSGGFAGFNDPVARPAGNAPAKGIVITAADTQNADWRKRTVLQNTYYTEVKNLIDQDELSEANKKLDQWAVEFPMSKMGGDYALAQAHYALKFDDFDRAARILEAYRAHVDLSPQLGEVMEIEWQCRSELGDDAKTRSLAADIVKRLPDIPLARDARAALAGQMPKGLLGRARNKPPQ